MTVSVIVVHHGNPDATRRCLESLEVQDHPACAGWLVDHSPDAGAKLLTGGLDRIRYLRPAENTGFGGGINAALANDDADTVLLLNPDAWAEPGWVTAMTAALDADPGAGSAACRVASGVRPGVLDSAGLGVSSGGMGILRGHGRPVDTPPEAMRVPLLGPAGSAAAYRRDLLDRLGGLPDIYFLYYEDLEIAFRARRHGAGCAWVDATLVTHDHLSGAGSDKLYYLHRGRRLFLERNWPDAWRQLRARALRDETAVSWARALATGRAADARRARRDAERILKDRPAGFDDPPADADWLAPVWWRRRRSSR